MLQQRQYSLIARTYAQALFNAARKQGILQRVTEEGKVLAAILQKTPRLLTFLGNPRIPTESKSGLITTTLRNRISPATLKMLDLLIKRDRTSQLPDILAYLQELVEQAEGIHHAVIESAVELGFQDKLRLKTGLEKHTGGRLRIDYLVNPKLIGGLVFRYRDLLIDSSISNGLDKIRRQLLATQI